MENYIRQDLYYRSLLKEEIHGFKKRIAIKKPDFRTMKVRFLYFSGPVNRIRRFKIHPEKIRIYKKNKALTIKISMKSENLSAYSTHELQKKYKEIKTGKIMNAFIIGTAVGIYIYSSVKHGIGLMTFFPLAIAYLIAKSAKNNEILGREILKELQSRNSL